MKSALLAEGGEKQCVVLQALSEAEMGGGCLHRGFRVASPLLRIALIHSLFGLSGSGVQHLGS